MNPAPVRAVAAKSPMLFPSLLSLFLACCGGSSASQAAEGRPAGDVPASDRTAANSIEADHGDLVAQADLRPPTQTEEMSEEPRVVCEHVIRVYRTHPLRPEISVDDCLPNLELKRSEMPPSSWTALAHCIQRAQDSLALERCDPEVSVNEVCLHMAVTMGQVMDAETMVRCIQAVGGAEDTMKDCGWEGWAQCMNRAQTTDELNACDPEAYWTCEGEMPGVDRAREQDAELVRVCERMLAVDPAAAPSVDECADLMHTFRGRIGSDDWIAFSGCVADATDVPQLDACITAGSEAYRD